MQKNKRLLSSIALVACAFVGVQPVAAQADETDPMAMAQIACENGNFTVLFDVMMFAPEVRKAYSAPYIYVVENEGTDGDFTQQIKRVAREDFSAFPVTFIDFDFAYAPTAYIRGEVNPNYEPLDVNFNQGQNEGWSVEWEKARYASVDGSDEYTKVVAHYGDSGSLYFAPTKDCWELDTVETFKRGPADRPVE